MAKLSWNDAGERLYEKGLDRGVLYLTDGSGIPWNGLRSVEEDPGGESTSPLYFDGIKYLDDQKLGDFSASMAAITFPDEFYDYEGIADLGDGFYADDQPPKPFGLTYRTGVGNDIQGLSFGYQVHIVYNVTAVAQAVTHTTLNDDPELSEFVWQLDAVPVAVDGYRPTAHFIFDSTLLPPPILKKIEDILYGTDETEPHLPTVDELFGTLLVIIDNGDGTWTAIGPDNIVYMTGPDTFEIDSSLAEYIDSESYTLSSP